MFQPTVLLIDDNEDIVDLLSMVLRRKGYRVVFAGTGAEGLEHLMAATLPNLVLLDVQLPDMTGPELLDQIEADRPEIFEKCQILYYSAGQAPADNRVAGAFNKMLDTRSILSSIARRLPMAN